MKQDIDTKSFYLPETVFIYDGVVAGYIADYFGESIDPFNCSHMSKEEEFTYDFSKNNLKRINFERIFDAREKLIRDVYRLSEEKVLIQDVTFNLLYDGSRFGVIDTLGFKKVDFDPLLKNIDIIDNAILNEFDLYDKSFHPNFNESLEKNVQRIRTSSY